MDLQSEASEVAFCSWSPKGVGDMLRGEFVEWFPNSTQGPASRVEPQNQRLVKILRSF